MVRAWVSIASGAALAAAAASVSAADLTIVSQASRNGAAPEKVTSYITSTKIRMAQPGRDIIIDGAKSEYTIVDHTRKEYTVITKQDLQDAAAQMQQRAQEAQAAMAKMQEQLKNVPPAMREKLQAMLGGGGMMGAAASMIDVKKGSGSRTIAGYACDNWIVSVGELSKTEECLSTEVPFPADAWQAYRDLADTFKAMGMGQGMQQLQDKTKDLRGFPLAATTTTSIMGKTSTDTSEVKEIIKGAVPATAFDVPAGYKKGESPFKTMGRPRK
jgi:hypothetical protein